MKTIKKLKMRYQPPRIIYNSKIKSNLMSNKNLDIYDLIAMKSHY